MLQMLSGHGALRGLMGHLFAGRRAGGLLPFMEPRAFALPAGAAFVDFNVTGGDVLLQFGSSSIESDWDPAAAKYHQANAYGVEPVPVPEGCTHVAALALQPVPTRISIRSMSFSEFPGYGGAQSAMRWTGTAATKYVTLAEPITALPFSIVLRCRSHTTGAQHNFALTGAAANSNNSTARIRVTSSDLWSAAWVSSTGTVTQTGTTQMTRQVDLETTVMACFTLVDTDKVRVRIQYWDGVDRDTNPLSEAYEPTQVTSGETQTFTTQTVFGLGGLFAAPNVQLGNLDEVIWAFVIAEDLTDPLLGTRESNPFLRAWTAYDSAPLGYIARHLGIDPAKFRVRIDNRSKYPQRDLVSGRLLQPHPTFSGAVTDVVHTGYKMRGNNAILATDAAHVVNLPVTDQESGPHELPACDSCVWIGHTHVDARVAMGAPPDVSDATQRQAPAAGTRLVFGRGGTIQAETRNESGASSDTSQLNLLQTDFKLDLYTPASGPHTFTEQTGTIDLATGNSPIPGLGPRTSQWRRVLPDGIAQPDAVIWSVGFGGKHTEHEDISHAVARAGYAFVCMDYADVTGNTGDFDYRDRIPQFEELIHRIDEVLGYFPQRIVLAGHSGGGIGMMAMVGQKVYLRVGVGTDETPYGPAYVTPNGGGQVVGFAGISIPGRQADWNGHAKVYDDVEHGNAWAALLDKPHLIVTGTRDVDQVSGEPWQERFYPYAVANTTRAARVIGQDWNHLFGGAISDDVKYTKPEDPIQNALLCNLFVCFVDACMGVEAAAAKMRVGWDDPHMSEFYQSRGW